MTLRIPERALLFGLLITLLLTLLAGLHRLGGRLQPIENLERLSLDQRFRLRGPQAHGDAVALVVIDDETVRRYPELAERRAPFAALLEAIAADDAAVIGVDGILADPEHLLGAALEADIRAHVDAAPRSDAPAERLLRRVADEVSGDRKLEAALRAVGRVVLGFHLGRRGEPLGADPALRKGRYDQSILGPQPPPAADRGLVSLPTLNDAALALGSITLVEDQDQAVRELGFARSHDGAIYAPLVVPLLAAYDGAGPGALAYRGDTQTARIGGRTIDLADDRLILNFRGPDATFPTYSAADVLDDAIADALAGKIVIVGITYLGNDRIRSPFAPRLPALEVHATAIDNVLAGDPIERASPLFDVLLCALAGLLTTLLFSRRLDGSPALRFGGLGLLAVAQLVAAYVAFAAADLWIGVVWPMAAIVIIGGVGLGAAYAGEARQRRWLRRSFSQYLGDETLGELLADPSAVGLGGARRRLSILFSDIRDFTSISESLSPEELVDLLNTFLTPMSQAVLHRGGYLDKYIGDAVMAVFGAPVRHDDHAARALNTAIAMQRALDELNPGLASRGLRPLEVGVGVNTGDVVVGNMGSIERFDYTVIGDAVNLASRLEGLTKIYGARCLVGEATRREIAEGAETAGAFAFREVDRVRVKGKAQPVALFELLSGPDGALASYADLPRFAEALAAYRRGDLAAARAGFAAFAASNPDDRTAALYRERLAALGDVAPEGWDGVTTFTSK
ncbi:MAG: adenylate/guanylate cyclase domain-containing protein [Myxococcales bacterium]|nr:adenylate/guanylate cyclase domain-containing protein [Myxococcales bacterium]